MIEKKKILEKYSAVHFYLNVEYVHIDFLYEVM